MPDTNFSGLLNRFAGAHGDDAAAPPAAASPASSVDEIRLGRIDGRGQTIRRIYATHAGEYAIYLADGVGVQLADDPGRAEEQRRRVLTIGEARADLTSLLLGWNPRRRSVYDCKTAMALQLALDDQGSAAQKTIDGARADVLNERAAAGRLQYLASAVVSCAVLGTLLWVLSVWKPLSASASDNLWLAGQAGLAGAAFSIVLAIKSRTVALDTDLKGNASDGLLRLAIGTISGGFLLLLLASEIMPKFALGGAELSAAALTWQSVVVLGFVAGFVERMVPDLLDKAPKQQLGAPAQDPAAGGR